MSNKSPWRFIPRIRFSLLTLALGSLFVGSAGTLWWNWGPYGVAFVVDAPNSITKVVISNDDQFLYVLSGREGLTQIQLDVRRLPSGERHCLMDLKDRSGIYVSGRRMVIYERIDLRNVTLKLIDTETLKSLGHDDILNAPGMSCSVYPDHIDRSRRDMTTAEIFKLPEFSPVTTIEDIEMVPGHTNATNKIGHYRKGRLEIVDLETGKTVQTASTDKEIVALVFTPTTVIAYSRRPQSNGPGYVFSLADGRTLMSVDSQKDPATFSFDGTRCLRRTKAGIEIRDVFSGQIVATPKYVPGRRFSMGEFSKDGNLWLDGENGNVYHARTLELLWETNAEWGRFAGNGETIMTWKPWRVFGAQSGALWQDFSSLRWSEYEKADEILHAHSSSDFLFRKDNRVSYFRLRRPWQWYGVFVMPELWITLLLSGALAWSLRRDVGALRRSAV